jgi:hypothetical protein
VTRPAPETVRESYDVYQAPTFFKPLHLIVEKTDQEYFLTKQNYRGEGGYSPVKTTASTRRIDSTRWQYIQQFLTKNDFWKQRVHSINHWQYLDSTEVKVSARRGKEVKRVRQYGSYDTAVYELALKLNGIWTGKREP